MAVSRGPLARDIAKEYKKEIGSTSGSVTPTSGGRGGTPNCGPNARWNGTRCVSTASSGNIDIETRRALDKVDWNAVGRLMGNQPTSDKPEWAKIRESYTKTGAGSSGVPWDMMTDYEKRDALSKVDYDALGRLMGRTSGGGSTTANAPATTGGGGGGGGGSTTGGGGGGGATAAPSSQDAITEELLQALGGIEAFARNDINAAGDALLKSLGAYDPQAQFNLAQPSIGVPTASLAGYTGYIGGSPEQVQGAQQYAQSFADAFLGDVNRYQTGSAQAQDLFRGRQGDIARQNQATALMQLALNTMAARLGIRSGAARDRQNQLNTALQLALQYARPTGQGTGNLGFGVPNINYQTVTLPNGQVVAVPPNLFGGF